MSISSLTSKAISVIGNPEAITPLLIKDTATSYSLTQFAKRDGGSIESTDKFIDEFGTMAIWLGGIPFFKKILDKTLYKTAKLDPGTDVRVIQNEAHRQFAQKNATGEVKKAFDFASAHKTLTKNMFYAKFALATSLSLASYIALTRLRHHITKKKAREKAYQDMANEKFSQQLIFNSSKLKFSSIKRKSDKVSFGLTGRGFQAFMFDPALNTAIVDLGILSTRVATSRPSDNAKHKVLTPERVEYLAKDGFLLFFYYAFGHLIQPKLDKLIEKFTKNPIGLDARVLDSKEIVEAFKNTDQVKKDLNVFKGKKADLEILQFLQDNADNIITRAAKISNIVKCTKGTQDIDHGKYIKIDEIKKIAESVESLMNKINSSASKDAAKVLKSARNTKIGSILAGLGICIFGAGFVMPTFLYDVVRKYYNNGAKTFHVQERIEREAREELKKEHPELR